MRFLAVILLFVCTPWATTEAQRPPVRMQLETMSIRGRSGGAIPVLIKLEHEGNQILEGDLVLTIYQSQQTPDDILGNLRYEGIVLQGTDYFIKTILPPYAHSWTGQYLITGWFETADGKRISLSKDPKDPNAAFELLTPSPFVRTTLVCSCSGQVDYLKPSANRNYLNKILSLENYIPTGTPQNQQTASTLQASPSLRSQIRYFATSWDALNLPDNPLHLTCFDIVVLADRSLGRLDETQLDALKAWIDGGGSLCVLPDEQPLKSTHISFLKTLFESVDDPSFRISRTDTGKIEILSETPDEALHRRYGLGAVSLLPVTQNLEQLLTDQDKGQLAGHLWHVRHGLAIREGGPWLSQPAIDRLKRSGYQVEKRDGTWLARRTNGGNSVRNLWEISGRYQSEFDFTPKQNILTSTANTALMPKGVQMVPPWVIATLLLAYVATIGPIDYWLLGLLKARKFTWVLFPVVTAVFTGLTIMIAHAYMSSTETGGQISIVDVVDDGRAVRETSLQMNFFGAGTTVSTEHKQAFHVPAAMDQTQLVGMRNQPLPSAGNKPLNLSGRFPQNYRSEVSLSQWDPFLTRTFRLQPQVDNIPPIDWNDSTLVQTKDGRNRLITKLNDWDQQNKDLRIDAVVMHQSQAYQPQVYRLPTNRPAYVFDSSIVDRQTRLQQGYQYGFRWQQEGLGIGIGILESTDASSFNNYFSLVSQVAPQGDASLEDLPIVDLTDPQQWLLMIAVNRGHQLQIFRKVYHLPTSESDQPLQP